MATFIERVRGARPTRGTFLNLGSALVAEVCALSGFDWLLVDLEHGAGGEDALVGQILAGAAHGVPVVARVESSERIRVGHVLDLGALGVMFPRLDTPEEVARVAVGLAEADDAVLGRHLEHRADRVGLVHPDRVE